MTREELRQKLLAGADRLHNSIAWRLLSAEEKNIVLCGRLFWASDNPVTNAALDAFAAIVRSYHDVMVATCAPPPDDSFTVTSAGVDALMKTVFDAIVGWIIDEHKQPEADGRKA